MDAWERLGLLDADRVWERFYWEFEFRPSVDPSNFPGIREPVSSVTYALPRSDGHKRLPSPAENADLETAILAAFRACTPPDERIYALDWQHPSYWLSPHVGFEQWLAPVFPDGDYYIFVAPDFSWGVFGHPWEWTMCVFGAPLLAALNQRPPRLFTALIRQNGVTTETSS